MQNLKQMEDYKKDRLSKANQEGGDESELDNLDIRRWKRQQLNGYAERNR